MSAALVPSPSASAIASLELADGSAVAERVLAVPRTIEPIRHLRAVAAIGVALHHSIAKVYGNSGHAYGRLGAADAQCPTDLRLPRDPERRFARRDHDLWSDRGGPSPSGGAITLLFRKSFLLHAMIDFTSQVAETLIQILRDFPLVQRVPP